jgi:hypothetical protein
MRSAAILSFVVAGVLATAVQARTDPMDAGGIAAACGGELQKDEMLAMAQAKRLEKLSCFTREAAKQFNRTLPTKIDEATTLQRVGAEGPMLTYDYVVSLPKADLPANAMEAIKPKVREQVCASPDMRSIIAVGGSYRYRWSDRNAELIGETTVSACP